MATDYHSWANGRTLGKPIRPDDIPKNPRPHYERKGWKGWNDFLGSRIFYHKNIVFWSLKKAKKYVHNLKFNSANEFRNWKKGRIAGVPKYPTKLPKAPEQYYNKKGWIDWYDWLGTKRP